MGQKLLLAIRRRLHKVWRGERVHLNPLMITLLLGVGLAVGAIGMLELRLRPVVEALAEMQVHNRVTAEINRVLSDTATDYQNLVSTQYDQQGGILALTTDVAAVNGLRNQVSERVLAAVAGIDVHELGVPMGSLFDMDLAWAKGPAIRVHSLVAGTVQTRIHSQFTAAGINQTRHQIMLEVTVPLTILLPGISTQTEVSAVVCVAETVIVGRVPQTFLELPQISGTEGLPWM